jgi:hypothetical protein
MARIRPRTIDRRPHNRSAVTNDPLARVDGRTPTWRRIRDLYRAYSSALGDPSDAITQSAIFAASHLAAAAEDARHPKIGHYETETN